MKYYSTRDKAHARPWVRCAKPSRRAGARRGLFVPERIPQADMAVAERLAGESYAALAGYLAALFFGEDIDAGILQREIGRIYDFQVPLRPVGSRYTLELFHARRSRSRTSAPDSWAAWSACRAARTKSW